MIYKIEKELSNKRAIIYGEYKDLQIGAKVQIVDDKDNVYDAVVDTRSGGGMVLVSVKGFA